LKIIIISHSFLPNVGGLENIMAGLATEWSKSHDVIVYTKVKIRTTELILPYNIVRHWNLFSLWVAIANADVFVEANISLKTFWLGLLNYKKWVVIHHTCYSGHQNICFDIFKDNIRNYLTFFSNNIACSSFVARSLIGKSLVIPNFYNNQIFKKHSVVKQPNSLVFLGRLVSDKGVDLLLHAMYVLKQRGYKYHLTIVGDGPEDVTLKSIVNRFELQESVIFKGILKDNALALELNKHSTMIIPSRWKEPFGVVALEGLACGCRIICPHEGGLKEAAGSSAFLYVHNNLNSLIDVIERSSFSLLNIENDVKVQAHLLEHNQVVIAKRYIDYLNDLINEK
jgi:glycosyltransferase involved in cell wall biosynthesis